MVGLFRAESVRLSLARFIGSHQPCPTGGLTASAVDSTGGRCCTCPTVHVKTLMWGVTTGVADLGVLPLVTRTTSAASIVQWKKSGDRASHNEYYVHSPTWFVRHDMNGDWPARVRSISRRTYLNNGCESVGLYMLITWVAAHVDTQFYGAAKTTGDKVKDESREHWTDELFVVVNTVTVHTVQ